MTYLMPAGHFRLLQLLAASAVLLAMLGAQTPHEATKIIAKVSEGPALPLKTAGHVGAMIGGVPLVAGGTSWSDDGKTKRWVRECYVFKDGDWRAGPPLPRPLADAAYAAAATGGLYLAGGTIGKDDETAEVLHLRDTSPQSVWQPLPALPAPVEGAAGEILGNTFYVFGGFSQGKAGNRLLALDVSDPSATWRTLAPLPAPGRAFAALVASETSIYLFGGFTSPPYDSAIAVFSDAYWYDPASNRWQKLEGFDLAGYGWTATAVGPNQVMLTGRVPQAGNVTDEIWVVDLQSLTAQSVGRLVTPACCMPALHVASGTWWLSGGEPDAQRHRTARTSVVTLEGVSDR